MKALLFSALFERLRFRPLVLPVKAIFIWRSIWNYVGVMLTGKYRSTQWKIKVPICPPPSPTNPTWICQGCNSPLRGEGPATNEPILCLFVSFWWDSPQWTMASSFTRFLCQTQRRATFGNKTPLAEWSARRRDKTQHSQPTGIHTPAGFEPTFSSSEWPQTHALDRAATGTG